jgi:hypothetical protein
VIDALIEQAGVDLARGLVGETRRAQQIEHGLALHHSERALRARPGPAHDRRLGQIGALTVDAGPRQLQSRANAGGQAWRWRQDASVSIMTRRRGLASPAGCTAVLQLFFGYR